MHCTTAARENSVSAARQPPNASAVGTATSEATAAPPLRPDVQTPLANAGRSGKRSFTATGSSAPAIAMPTPTGSVSRSSSGAPGTAARASPNSATAPTDTPTTLRSPARLASGAASGAKAPMHSTGIVPSSPATACETPRSAWMSGSSGPAPTSWGRSASAATNSAASRIAPRR